MNIAVLIGRFQAPYLSDAALQLMENLKAHHQKLVVILGESPLPGSKNNPYDFSIRKNILNEAFPDLEVLSLEDHPSDEIWSENLDRLIKEEFPDETVTLYGSKDRVAPAYSGKHKLAELPEHFDFSEKIKTSSSVDFRKGILWAFRKQYDKVFPTVDIALFGNGKKEILLAKKETVNKWRLPGGFSDPEDGNYEASARRELTEECGDIETTEMSYETSFKIDDWRYKNENDKIITLLFSCDYRKGDLHAKDDIIDIKWFLVSELKQMISNEMIVDEHGGLLHFLVEKYS